MNFFKSNVKVENFWGHFLSDTNQFLKAELYSNSLDLEVDHNAIFRRFFIEYSSNSELRKIVKIRLYLNGQKADNALIEFKDTPPKEDDNLNDWGENLFQGKPWCIVLDKISGCIDDLTFPIAEWVKPLVSDYPPGELVVDISPYIGRYGFTPFGAHIDVPGISILHLHLGPNKKLMTLWEAEEFRKLSGSDSAICHNYKDFLPHGTTYTIEPGDIFHLPAGTHYHVGKADEFSIGLTIGLKRENSKSIIEKALKANKEDPFKLKGTAIVESYRLKRKSNAGFMKPSILKNSNGEDLWEKRVKINYPFELIIIEKDQKELQLYIRGRVKLIPNNQQNRDVIFSLNKGNELLLNNTYLNRESLHKNDLIELMVMLYNYGGIILV